MVTQPRRRKREPEPEQGQVIDVTTDGRGILDTGGKRIFVRGALKGEHITFKRSRRRRRRDDADLISVDEASPVRVTPRCDVFGACGGCSLQHANADAQLSLKQEALNSALSRIGKVAPESMLEPVRRAEWHYRRRARLGVRDVPGKGRVLVGFREAMAPYITDMKTCEVLERSASDLIEPLSAMIGELTIRHRLPQIEVTVADNATALVFRVLDEPGGNDLEVLRDFARKRDLNVYLQSKGPDTLAPLEPASPPPLFYKLPRYDLRIELGPTDFIQVNAPVNEAMIDQALGYLQPKPGMRVIDLYCGLGNFTLPLARLGTDVTGLEGEAGLVERARRNAELNGITNARFEMADLNEGMPMGRLGSAGCDLLLLDPPRSGAAAVIGDIAALAPGRIAYVSCHPGSLARDIGQLVHDHGYVLKAAGVLDMFPHTGHVESMAFLER